MDSFLKESNPGIIMKKSSIFIILSIIFQAISLLLMKFAAVSMEEYSLSTIIKNHFYILSIFTLFLQALFWQFSLRRLKLIIAYCYSSLIYVVMLISSSLFFKETITLQNLFGVAIIITGVIIFSLQSKRV